MKRRLFYFIREALNSFRKNWVMSVAAVATVFLSLCLVGIFSLFAFLGGMLIKGQESKVEIEVFLKDNAPPDQVQGLQNRINSWPEVTRAEYISKAQALKKLKGWLKDSPEILESLSGNPLPASIRIRLKNPREVENVAVKVTKQPNIDEVVGDLKKDIKYGQQYVPKLFAVTRVLRWIGIIFVAVLCFASLVLIVNTIRLAIFARREEIAIMRLVGASNWFISFPFVLEGILQGIIGAILATITLYAVKTFLFKFKTIQFLNWVGVEFNYSALLNQYYLLLAGLIISGIVIGALGSIIALRRYLKV